MFLNFLRAYIGLLKMHNILKKETGNVVVLMGLPGIGDTCIQGTYIDAFEKCYQKSCTIVCADTTAGVLKSLGYKRIVIVKRQEIVQLKACYSRQSTTRYCLYKRRQGKLIIADLWYYIRPECDYGENLCALDVMRYCAFSLIGKLNVEQMHPTLNMNLKKVQEKYGINSPYIIFNTQSNSMEIDVQIFEEIIKSLGTSEINLYTNIIKGQKEIPGTKGLMCGIDDFFALAGEAKAIISIRSGILDYIATSAKKIIALYDARKTYELCSLKTWNTNAEIYEYILDDKATSDNITKSIIGNLANEI